MSERMARVIVGVLCLSPLLALADDSNASGAQSMQRAAEQDREQVYGSQLMTAQERLQYREKMRSLKTNEEREAFRREHHEQMKQRAIERGVELPDMPPAQRQGMMQGQGVGSGMGAGQGKGR